MPRTLNDEPQRNSIDYEKLINESPDALSYISNSNFHNRWENLPDWAWSNKDSLEMIVHPSELGNMRSNRENPEKYFKHMPSIVNPGGVQQDNVKTIKYKFNKNFFRSDEFINDPDHRSAVFLGCSITEGVGGHLEDTWPYMVYQHLLNSNKIDSGFFNLGISGGGAQTVLSNLIKYVSISGAPKYAFILMPASYRQYAWNKTTWSWVTRGMVPNNIIEDKEYTAEDGKIYQSKNKVVAAQTKYMNGLPAIMHTMWTLIEYCKQIGTELFFSTWSNGEIEFFKLFDGFVEFPALTKEEAKKVLKKFEVIKDDNVANFVLQNNPDFEIKDENYLSFRDGHPGTMFHEFWSSNFIKAIEERGI